MTPPLSQFPIDPALPDIRRAIGSNLRVILSAPPGAGKTTRVPPSLLNESWLGGKKILMLEPRRLAARSAAEFIADSLRERVGTTIGYRIRGDVSVSPATRIEVVTEGILTRMLVQDQDLPDVGAVIFDEFHERSIHADLGLALILDLQKHIRPDLRILVMSATLDVEPLQHLLGDAAYISVEGRSFSVAIMHDGSDESSPVDVRTAAAISRALRSHEGDILAFLPGIGEIRRTENRLIDRGIPEGTIVHQLYGDAGFEQQREALLPAPKGGRKVILSTSIAETSLTIDGIRVVIDAGLSRTARYDPARDMSGLVTVPVSQAVADQRAGRAGRTAEGACYRLWPEHRHSSLSAYPTPEIKATDLTHLALDLAAWGDPTGSGLSFLDPPPDASIQRARTLLSELGALDHGGRLTPHGHALATFPVHPRYGHMILRAKDLGHGSLACLIAALLEGRDVLAGRRNEDIDLRDRIMLVSGKRTHASFDRIRDQARRLRDLADIGHTAPDADNAGRVLGLAYPDRIARKRAGSDTYLLTSGKSGVLPAKSVLGKHEFLAVGHVDSGKETVRILLAAPIRKSDVESICSHSLTEAPEVRWDPPSSSVIARMARKAGNIVLDERPLTEETEELRRAFLDGVRTLGLDALPWDKETQSLVQRAEWVRVHGNMTDPLPDLSDSGLLASLEEWLAPFVHGMRRREHLTRLDMKQVILSFFTHKQRTELDRLAPPTLTVPSGSKIRISYEGQDAPLLAVKLQELFGLTETPCIMHGNVPVTIHLLSPASRPLAVTQDLPSFWKNTYPQIRKQMQARYPKHPWPEDPLSAMPTKKTVRRKR